ncbi:hypothetical protein PYCCODRAFT_1426789 [Trametes coccinea BRFM310]|uniref:Fungal N-terminal domain-containing protein n=1 Tax=Trametes coccinea (strain BRFM310) TaxID=1353009 RepID=A0A1Y2IFU9_TRAC3|nr:hypothetical protein PYCCODRAFT_1426789 [Trametes coccinea BRFM310]
MIPLLDIALSVLETSKAALDVVPIPGVSIAIDTLIVLLDIIKGLKTNQRAVEELIRDILSISAAVNSAVRDAQSFLVFLPRDPGGGKATGNQYAPLLARLDKLQAALLRLTAEATKLQSGTRWRKLFRSNQDLRVIRRLKKEAELVLVEFRLGCNMSVEALLYDVASRLAMVQRA